MIVFKNVHKSYPMGKESLHVLKGLDLDIKEGGKKNVIGREAKEGNRRERKRKKVSEKGRGRGY